MRQSLDKLQIMSNYSFHSEVEHYPRPQPSMLNNSQPGAPKGSLLSQTGQAQGGGLPSCPGPQPWRGHPRRRIAFLCHAPNHRGPSFQGYPVSEQDMVGRACDSAGVLSPVASSHLEVAPHCQGCKNLGHW